MSISGRIVYCKPVTAQAHPVTGNQALRYSYVYSPAYNPPTGGVIEGGDVFVEFDGLTETEISAEAQALILTQANAETNGEEQFEPSDVRGGRI